MASGGFLQSTKGGFISTPSGGGGVDHDAAITINESGGDANFRVESDDKNNMLIVDGGTNRVGIGLHDTGGGVTPEAVLDIATGATSNPLCILIQEDGANTQSIIFREAGYNLFSLTYDGTGSSPGNLFKIRSANGGDGTIDTDCITVSQVGNIGIGSSTFNASAVGTLAIGNGTAPAAGTANQSYIYAKDELSSSEMYVMDEAGNETKISPHNQRSEWEFYSKNRNTGRCVRVNMERMIRRLEELHPGENFMEEWNE